jgi:hypothetical protein
MKTALFILTGVLALSACSSNKPPPPTASAAQPAPAIPDSNVFSTDLKALQKAKNVQNIVNDQQKAADQKLKDDGG